MLIEPFFKRFHYLYDLFGRDIENLLGTKVNLQLWVKIREDWRNRMDDLRTLGYES